MFEKIRSYLKGKTFDEKKRKKHSLMIIGLLFALILLSGIMVGSRYRYIEEERERRNSMGDMLVWYTSDSLTPYMDYVAKDYEKETGMHIVVKKVSPADYLEQIYKASISEEMTTPDVYITTNDCLEQAYLSGIATEQYLSVTKEDFSESAIHAVTYKGKQIASPLYFDTSLLFYNKNYTENAPKTMDELLAFAEAFEEVEGVENILKWDCSNGFRNYFFAGGYLNVAGEDGDDAEQLDVTNDSLLQALSYFHSMNDYFSIDMDAVTEENVREEFIAGKTVFVFGDTSWFAALNDAGMTNWGVAPMPDLKEGLEGRSIAVTDVAAVNGFSNKQEEAAAFVRALTVDYVEALYGLSKKVPASTKIDMTQEYCITARAQYATCRQLPKLMDLGDFWMRFEITMADVWKGKDAAAEMNEFKAQMESRLKD